ncbi:MAG: glutathione peroxidase [Burkholderiales bacterium]|jgi:glutathione peroxidase|nr:glutathione peroxidase [Burkholderiales bacterium]
MNEFVGFSGRLRRNVLRVGAALPWLLAGLFSGFAVDRAHAAGATTAPCPVLLDRTMARLQDDAPQQLCQYAGRVALVVNTASYCGYTRQYEGLEALFRAYRSRGFVILGFPSNDFGQQEPGSASQIADLCFNTYGVAFPMFAKTVVSGAKADPFFAALAKSAGSAPKWNFHKYLIGRDGKVLAAYPSAIEPNDPTLRRDLERALGR